MTPLPQASALPWRKLWSHGLACLLCALGSAFVLEVHAQVNPDTTFNLPFPHDNGDMFNPTEFPGGVSLQWPSNFNYGVVYNPVTGLYEVQQTIGDTLQFRPSSVFTLDEYLDYNITGNLSEFWNELQEEEDEADRAFAPKLEIDSELFEMIFGSNEIEIKPQGTAEISLGYTWNNTENPRIPERQRRAGSVDFDQRIQLNLGGKIGDKIELGTQFNTQALFDFENQMNIGFQGEEDDILKNIEAGNISMPLNSTLIAGSQSLFGLKLETQWGRLYNTTVFSQQKGERSEIEVEGGAQTQEFDIRADDYEANRHYFLSQYFVDQYDEAMRSLPVPNSGAMINRIEVYVVNTQANTQDVRNILAFTDLGEHPSYLSTNVPAGDLTNNPSVFTGEGLEPATEATQNRAPNNYNNDLFRSMTLNESVMNYTGANQAISTALGGDLKQGVHYERVGNARRLSPSEFTYNSRLGFVSLRQALNNAEVLAVAYEYTLNGETYQVGTLSQDGYAAPGALVLKMLKSSVTQVKLDNGDQAPLWRTMMKNVYSMGAFGVSNEEFRLDIWYNDPNSGVDLNYIPRQPLDGRLLIQVLGMDRIDINGMPNQDGVFDYVDNAAVQGGTINSQNGRIFLPSVEPFGSNLAEKIGEYVAESDIAPSDQDAVRDALVQSLVFHPLYDSTKTAAQQIPSLNRFRIKGRFQSQSSSEIQLNALNVPEGSVTVTAGGVRLEENRDYTVDYNLGRVRIINDGLLESGQTIKVSLESNSLFNIQTKTLLGTRFDYVASDNFNIGTTLLNMRERPLTRKVNMGDEPVNNTVVGADFSWQTESRLLTELVDRLPFYSTTAKSTFDISAEGAYLIPGHSRAVGDEGTAYIDDFEGSQSTIDLRAVNRWFLASTPRWQNDRFPEGALENDLASNYNRAGLSWYTIDPSLINGSALQDGQVDAETRQDHRMRQILLRELYEKGDYSNSATAGMPTNLPTLDLTFRPTERGPYNYEPFEGSDVSPGLEPDGALKNPDERWAGIQRALTTTDFEAANIEYIQFWVMDPFNDDSENETGGRLYVNLGNVSEDILNDSQLQFENGLPSANNNELETDTSTWGIYPDPTTFNVVNAFDNSTNDYSAQDVGLDGLNSEAEQTFFATWLNGLSTALEPDAFAQYQNDPSADDFRYFRDPVAQANEEDILERYQFFSRYEGNSNTQQPDGYPITSTTIPNTEDINEDLTLGTIESYYQYEIPMTKADLSPDNIGKGYLSDILETVSKTNGAGEQRPIKWYQFKIPVREYQRAYNGISDFRSIRFMRMFMQGWSEPVTLRFARIELVRGEWRRYEQSLAGLQELEVDDPTGTQFALSAVNLEENGVRQPVPYVIPPGINQEIDPSNLNQRRLNEQSLSLEVCGLEDGDARAAYRNINFDMRMYERLRMFVHVEAGRQDEILNEGDVNVFVRLGSDYDQNYYEYEIPLRPTPIDVTALDEYDIWPLENNIDINLDSLRQLSLDKLSNRYVDGELSTNGVYSVVDESGRRRLSVKGNPTLSNVVTVMVGIRNPDKDLEQPLWSSDDGEPKCAELWVNELRLSGFNEEGGWAAVAQANATLADLANVSVAANMSVPGWGGLEQRVQERQRETIQGLDANGTIQLGKLLPERLGITLPMYVGYSNQRSTPQFDPLSPDVEMTDLAALADQITEEDDIEAIDSRQQSARSVNEVRSINFSNVKIAPQFGKKGGGSKDRNNRGNNDPKGDKVTEERERFGSNNPRGGGSSGRGGGSSSGGLFSIVNPANFSANYSYNEQYRRDIYTDNFRNVEHRGGLNYSWQPKPKKRQPFSKVGFLRNSEYLRLIRDLNFYLLPKQVSASNQMQRMYEVSTVRDNMAVLNPATDFEPIITPQVVKTWTWNRNYTVKYDLTQALKFDYQGTAQALILENPGLIPSEVEDPDGFNAYREEVQSSLMQGGEVTNYNHQVNGTYKLPLDKFPLTDWLSADTRYQSSFRWDRAPFAQDTLGNTIQNSRNLSLNTQANLKNFYNKVPFLKEINNKRRPRPSSRNVSNEKRDGFGKIEDDEEKEKIELNPMEHILRFVMGLHNVSGTYARNEGTMLPGFNQRATYAGFDQNFAAPGLPFLVGHQYTDLYGNGFGDGVFAQQAASNGWLVQQPNLNNQYTESYSENFNVRANLEPIRDFKVELTANRNITKNYQSFFRYDEDLQDYVNESANETGNFTATVMSWPTAFVDDDSTYTNAVWENFLAGRRAISSRQNELNYNDELNEIGYAPGFGPISQNVVVPSFMAAYLGMAPEDVPLDVFQAPVRPNWRVTYDGLSKNPTLKKTFKRFSLNHSYRSTMSTAYTTNLGFEGDDQGRPIATDQGDYQDYISQRQYNSVTISEQLSPLVGVDMSIKTANDNEPQVRFEVTMDRNVNLGLSNYQITETKTKGIVIGVGYKFDDVPNPFLRTYGKLPIKMLKKTDFLVRCDINIRENSTVIRKMVEQQNQVTAGQRLVSIKLSGDLEVSDKMTLRAFYDQQINKPKVSTSFATTNISSGIALRFNLTQ
ncbi:MAG: cell surface protein SprA [Bacteroidota bacterium]|nr:cell surface protein SprA [Bacteroidota bacterium]